MKMGTKRRAIKLLVSLILGTVVSGCDHLSSIDHVIASAYRAVYREDLKAFSETLTGKAFDTYANETAMRELKAEFDGLKLEIENTVLLSSASCGERCKLEFYSVQILGHSSDHWTASAQYSRTANVECKVLYHHSTNTGQWVPLITCKVSNYQ